MWKQFAALVLAGILLVSCQQDIVPERHAFKKMNVQTERTIPDDFIPRTLSIAAVGDSLTEGIGDSTHTGGYLPYLKTLLEKEKGIREADFKNFGVKGTRSEQLLERLRQKKVVMGIRNADMVVITIGGNDIMKVARNNILNLQVESFKKEEQAYLKRLDQIVKKIRTENPNAMVVLIGVYNPFMQWFPDVQELDQIVSDWNEAEKALLSHYTDTYFVEISDLFAIGEENLLFDDQFHPNDKGYQLIAERVYETLEDEALPAFARKSANAGDKGEY
ncbi:GDSL family lipase [Neobacillus piezotolerans]|uniref:GDSL family lipase n=1 Tax=Neobacillus piezotolerans TaxID=2259171 RepID=A0A3D8GQW1_9BACI|nr:SGNH/GDSL hydrolase family protein [Neobacillus piezotolerans]RDU36436.1 GDSL family lipase [Neobacillus piezotolerans]